MKRKRFYKNSQRNQKWTEEIQGRQIDFADKYIVMEDGLYSDKYDYMRPKKKKKKRFTREKAEKILKAAGAVILSLFIIGIGYASMDVYMIRNAMPVETVDEPYIQNNMNEISLGLQSEYAESISLDGSVMLQAVIDELEDGGYNSVTFDLKRGEGSVGYRSALASVDTYGAIAFPATDLKGSVSILKDRDILAVGKVYCYLDNLTPGTEKAAAILNSDGVFYRDSSDNTYLNPDSQITYSYIRDIIQEAYEMGVTVFVLDGVNLPNEISNDYNDGFDYISRRLYNDIGTDIKLLEAVNVNLSRDSVQNNDNEFENQSSEIQRKLGEDIGADKVYFVKSLADRALIKEKLEESGISNYILAD